MPDELWLELELWGVLELCEEELDAAPEESPPPQPMRLKQTTGSTRATARHRS